MKNWIIIYVIGDEVLIHLVTAENIIDAAYMSGIPIETIVSVQCVNTNAHT